VPLNEIAANWDQVVASPEISRLGHLGTLTSITVGGAPGLIADIDGLQSGGQSYAGQLAFVDYGNTTYIVALASSPGQFAQFRDTDFATILSSWQWLR
jgi:hypothetical protein